MIRCGGAYNRIRRGIMWFVNYRHKVKQRPKAKDWVVQVLEGSSIKQVLYFATCNSALSWVERREAFMRNA